MGPLNWLMNHTSEMTYSDSFFKKHVASRVTTIVGGIPLEMLATTQNMIKLPFEAALMVVKIPAKVVNLCIDSQTFKEFENSLPGPLDLIKTALKIIGYAIGTVFSASLGFFSPRANFWLHTTFGLIKNEKVEAERLKSEQEAARLAESQQKALQAHIQSLVLAIRLKIAEKERLIAEEERKRKEMEEAEKIRIEAEKKEQELKIQEMLLSAKQAPSVEMAEEQRLKESVEKAVASQMAQEQKQVSSDTKEVPALAKEASTVQESPAPQAAPTAKDTFFNRYFGSWFKTKTQSAA